tara:strand:+ start:6187 stop:6807 length:621 start_codon:yes stop_codon:yes gene_type:complete
MEQLVMAIALPLAKQYGMNKALEMAYERLGIAAPEEQDPFIYGMNQPFSAGNLTNMLKRAGIRSGANMLMNNLPSGILPLVGITGVATLANKYRKQLTGYDTQTAYEAARQERIANKRLDNITDRMLDGKDYANYEDALLDSGAGAIKIDDTIYSGPDYQGTNERDGGQDIGPTTSSSVGYTSKDADRESYRGRFSEGGIASLWQR